MEIINFVNVRELWDKQLKDGRWNHTGPQYLPSSRFKLPDLINYSRFPISLLLPEEPHHPEQG